VVEIRSLVEGFADAGVLSKRWRELASRKLIEIDALMTHAEQMKQLLEQSLDCGCLTLDACAVVLERRQNATTTDAV
jgi:MerR family transcriptional regulator, redox-sensitive transcriptional activator SoxR